MASPVYADPDGPLRLAVLGDSTSFTGPTGPLLPDDPMLYPNIAARAIGEAIGRKVAVTVLAHPGSGVRDGFYAVTKDRHAMFEVLMKADAVMVALGSFDHAPAGVLPWVEALVSFVRPARLRRRIRLALRALHPWGVRATFGRLARVPSAEFERLFDGILHEVRSLSWGAPGVVLGPTTHRSGYYAHTHPQHAPRTEMTRRLAGAHGFPFVEVWPLVRAYEEKLNPDGIHWPFDAHSAVGLAAAAPLVAQLRGEAPPPGIPPVDGPRRWAG